MLVALGLRGCPIEVPAMPSHDRPRLPVSAQHHPPSIGRAPDLWPFLTGIPHRAQRKIIAAPTLGDHFLRPRTWALCQILTVVKAPSLTWQDFLRPSFGPLRMAD